MSYTLSSSAPEKLKLDSLNRILKRRIESNLKPCHIEEFRKYIGSAFSSYCGTVGREPSKLSSDEAIYFRHMQKRYRRNVTNGKWMMTCVKVCINEYLVASKNSAVRMENDISNQFTSEKGKTKSLSDVLPRGKKRKAGNAFTAGSGDDSGSNTASSRRQKVMNVQFADNDDEGSNDDETGSQEDNDPAIDDNHEKDTPMPDNTTAAKEFRRKLQDLRNKQHKLTIKELTMLLESLENSILTSSDLTKCKELINILEEKYKKRYLDFTWTTPKPQEHPTLTTEFAERLAGSEEVKRPWLGTAEKRTEEIPGLLLRAWDQMSQCRINDNRVGFLSGGSANTLNTYEERREWLGRHADWGNRRATPFISFSKDLFDMNDTWIKTFERRQKRKNILENTKLTIINTRVRMAKGKPIMRMKTELLHYEVTDKCGYLKGSSSMFEHEYIIPFSVTPEEIVATYSYPKVLKWMQDRGTTFEGWYKEVAMPAWEEHERIRRGGKPVQACKKDCACCGH